MLFGLLDRDSQVALIFAALVAAGCGGGGGGDGGERRELVDVGWGHADVWHRSDPELVDYAARKGLRFVVLEHFPTVQEPERDWRRGDVLESFPDLVAELNRRACRNGQTMIVFGINWNVIPLRTLPDSWAESVWHEIAATYDPACTWLEPLVEPDEGDVAKARRWARMAADIWPGEIILPAAGAHWQEIRHRFVDYHPGSVGEAEHRIRMAGPGALIVTDGGPFVHPPDVLGELGRLTALALERGVPLVHYTDRYAPGDAAAHRAVIDAIAAGIP